MAYPQVQMFHKTHDTLVTCCYSPKHMSKYVRGDLIPHYPVPAIPVVVDLEYGSILTVIDKNDSSTLYDWFKRTL